MPYFVEMERLTGGVFSGWEQLEGPFDSYADADKARQLVVLPYVMPMPGVRIQYIA